MYILFVQTTEQKLKTQSSSIVDHSHVLNAAAARHHSKSIEQDPFLHRSIHLNRKCVATRNIWTKLANNIYKQDFGGESTTRRVCRSKRQLTTRKFMTYLILIGKSILRTNRGFPLPGKNCLVFWRSTFQVINTFSGCYSP